MSHSYTNLLYHIVFATKDRRPWVDAAVAERLHPYLGAGVRGEQGTALAINGTADHVHILARLRQDQALSEVVRAIKANSSKWVHGTFRSHRTFAWQTGYGAFSVSESQAARVAAYIRDQERHHRRRTFEEEFRDLLKRNGIPFDPDRLWR